MTNNQIALVHCPISNQYKLRKFTEEHLQDDSSVMWVFSSTDTATAKKIMQNMNIAKSLNSSVPSVRVLA